MPILNMQRRMRQLGEIRIGHVVPMANGKSRPEKLSQFRFTSPSKPILEAVAAAYGGEVKPWTPANGGPEEYEVYSTSNRLPVIIPPLAVTQWREMYQGSKCVRRCDGVQELKQDKPCMCDPDKPDCSIVTRLNVMLRDVSPIGYWLLISHGYYAAMELPPVADLLAQTGGHTPGWLAVEERRVVREKPGGGTETNRFMVPTLDIDIAPAQLLASQGNTAAQLTTGAAPQIAAPEQRAIEPAPTDCSAFIARAMESRTSDDVRNIWRDASASGCLDAEVTVEGRTMELSAMLKTLGEQFAKIEAANSNRIRPVQNVPLLDNPRDPEDPAAIWMQCLAAVASFNWSTDDLVADFASAHGGQQPADVDSAVLGAYLVTLKNRDPSATMPGVPY